MELVLIRHGEPEWVREGLSVDDPPLTERGRVQAEHLGHRFATEPVDEILVSTLRRARETAEPVTAVASAEASVEDWLAEIRAPEFAGTPSEAVERFFADHRERPVERHWDGLEGGESFRDFHLRVTGGLDRRLADAGIERVADEPRLWRIDDPDRRVAVVAHAGTNAVLLAHLLGIPPTPWEWERFVSFHASVSIIRPVAIAGAWSFSLFRFADVSHLPEAIQTR